MPKYNYVAMDSNGKETKGTLEVASQNEAIGRVKEMGLFPTKIVELDKENPKSRPSGSQTWRQTRQGQEKGPDQYHYPRLGGRVKPKVLTTFTRQLATLVDAGLPLLRGLPCSKSRRNIRPLSHHR